MQTSDAESVERGEATQTDDRNKKLKTGNGKRFRKQIDADEGSRRPRVRRRPPARPPNSPSHKQKKGRMNLKGIPEPSLPNKLQTQATRLNFDALCTLSPWRIPLYNHEGGGCRERATKWC